MTALVRRVSESALAPADALRVRHYVEQGRSEHTTRAYRSDVRRFVEWCDAQGFPSMPSTGDVVAAYLASRADAGLRPSTIERGLAAISKAHELAGYPGISRDPVIRATLAGIRRVKGVKQRGRDPILVDDLKRIVAAIPEDTLGLRDRAMLLVGFAAALRRSEVVSLDVAHLLFSERGVLLVLPRSKTDQEGQGQHVAVPFAQDAATCPVRSLTAWLERARTAARRQKRVDLPTDPVFQRVVQNAATGERLSAQTVKDVVKRRAEAVGMDATQLGGHSLRAGYVTSAALAGVPESKTRSVTRHKTDDMVRRYIRINDLFAHNATSELL